MLNAQHLGVYAAISKDGEILLVKKSRGPYKGKWDLPGGKLEHGESVEVALQREVKEETGLEVATASWIKNASALVEFVDERGKISMHHIGLIYQVQVKDISKLDKTIAQEDVHGAQWFSIEQGIQQPLSPFAREVCQNI